MTKERDAVITAARHLLESDAAIKPEQICKAIVEIGKPYDAEAIGSHAALVATYLDHQNRLVRHEAVWFLGSWGHLPAYASRILDTARTDLDVYNRAFAAKSLGSILKQAKNPALTESLLAFVEDEHEEIEVRSSAYSGLLYAWNKADVCAFLVGDKTISEVDREYLKDLRAWTQGKAERPPVMPSKGLLRSLFQASRAGLI